MLPLARPHTAPRVDLSVLVTFFRGGVRSPAPEEPVRCKIVPTFSDWVRLSRPARDQICSPVNLLFFISSSTLARRTGMSDGTILGVQVTLAMDSILHYMEVFRRSGQAHLLRGQGGTRCRP